MEKGIPIEFYLCEINGELFKIPAEKVVGIDTERGIIQIITDSGLEAMKRGSVDRPEGA
jgi:hypothetical protein